MLSNSPMGRAAAYGVSASDDDATRRLTGQELPPRQTTTSAGRRPFPLVMGSGLRPVLLMCIAADRPTSSTRNAALTTAHAVRTQDAEMDTRVEALERELRRAGIDFASDVWMTSGAILGRDRVTLKGAGDQVEQCWSGSVDDALRVASALPDRAGVDALWRELSRLRS